MMLQKKPTKYISQYDRPPQNLRFMYCTEPKLLVDEASLLWASFCSSSAIVLFRLATSRSDSTRMCCNFWNDNYVSTDTEIVYLFIYKVEALPC